MSFARVLKYAEKNSDFLIITALFFILQKEKADRSLLFALLFIVA